MAKDRWLTIRKPSDLIPRTGAPVTPPTAYSPVGTGIPPRSDVLPISLQVGTIPAGGIADLPERKLLEPYIGEFPPGTELIRTQHGTPTVFEAEGEEYPEGRLRGPLSGLERERPGGAAAGEGIYSGEEFKVGEQYFEDYGEEFGTSALYEMGVPKNLVEETFLDLDAPMSEQSEGMEERLMNLLRGINPEAVNQLSDDPTGEEVFKMAEKELFTGWLMADKQLRSGKPPKLELARRLQAQGIPGLRFLDMYSRSGHREAVPESAYEFSLWGDVYDLDVDNHSSADVVYRIALSKIAHEIARRDMSERLAKKEGKTYEEFTPALAALNPPVERTPSGTDMTASSKENVVKKVLESEKRSSAKKDALSRGAGRGTTQYISEGVVQILESLLDDIGALEIRDKPRTRNHVVWDQRLLDQISRSTLTRKKAAGGFVDKPFYDRAV